MVFTISYTYLTSAKAIHIDLLQGPDEAVLLMTGMLQKWPRLKEPFIFAQDLFTSLIRLLESYPFFRNLNKVARKEGSCA